MATEPMLSPLQIPAMQGCRSASSTVLSEYWALTKPEVNFLIVVTTFAGFYLSNASLSREFPLLLSINTVLGTLLVASGTGALNQYIERHFDAQMRRTARRPLAAGRLNPPAVLWFGIALSVIGTIYLAAAVNGLASLLALFTLLSYLLLYTPLKRKTPLCVLVGAIPGATPPLIGWVAASGKLNSEAWMLYALLFLWQFPHFMAIAWIYREDYARAGYPVLPRDGRTRARFVNLQTLLPLAAMVPLSLLPVLAGKASPLFSFGALLLSVAFFYCGMQFILSKSSSAARKLLAASIIYLPLLFLLIVLA